LEELSSQAPVILNVLSLQDTHRKIKITSN